MFSSPGSLITTNEATSETVFKLQTIAQQQQMSASVQPADWEQPRSPAGLRQTDAGLDGKTQEFHCQSFSRLFKLKGSYEYLRKSILKHKGFVLLTRDSYKYSVKDEITKKGIQERGGEKDIG